MNVAGICIGTVAGVTSAIITLVILSKLMETPPKNVKSVVAFIGELTALLAFVFTASFLLNSPLFKENDIVQLKDTYLSFLALSFLIVLIHPIFKWIIRLGKEFGTAKGGIE